MANIPTTPDELQAALDRAGPGDRVQLQAGNYTGDYTISRRHGRADAPIIIEPATGVDPKDCEISQRVSAEDYRLTGNQLSLQATTFGYGYPGLYPWIDDARLRIYRCRHVIVRELRFSQSWPSHIFIEESRDIAVQDCNFEDSTFCIGARGITTRDILIERCQWIQDVVPDRMWHSIPWKRIHHSDVDVTGDYRLFDGDFFRANEIQGGVTIRYCTVKAAFNAIHGFNEPGAAGLNLDFHIHHNRFEQIRDNVFEPEDRAGNWWFHDNDMMDVHKWFSVECHSRGPMYIFANTGSFRTLQGSEPPLGEVDDNNGGAVFKSIKKVSGAGGPFEPLYVFHNSFRIRSRYIKKGLIPELKHLNNAVVYAPTPGEPPRLGGFFGEPDGTDTEGRFTSDWDKWAIEFDGDVIGYPGFADELRPLGYPFGATMLEGDPGFTGPGLKPEDFQPGQKSICREISVPFRIMLPSSDWTAPGGVDVGVFQVPFASGEMTRFQGPVFEPTLIKLEDDPVTLGVLTS